MQDSQVMIREDVTVSLDKDLIDAMLGIAEERGATLSVLVRDVLGAFCRAFSAGTDWTRTVPGALQPGYAGGEETTGAGGADQVAVLMSRLTAHDAMIADLSARLGLLESGSASSMHPVHAAFPVTVPAGMAESSLPVQSRIAEVFDCDAPRPEGVSDDALVKMRAPVSPVFVSVDMTSLGKIIPNQVYSITEAAALLSMSLSTIRKYVRDGRIVGKKVGRSTVFQGQDLISYNERMRS